MRLSVFVAGLCWCLSAMGQTVFDDSTLEGRAASLGLTCPLDIKSVATSTNTGSTIIETASSSGLPAKIGFDGTPGSKDRWTFIVAGERLRKGSREEAIVIELLSAWVATNVPADIAGAIAKGRYSDAQELILSEMSEEETNPFCLRLLDVLTNAAKEAKRPPPRAKPAPAERRPAEEE